MLKKLRIINKKGISTETIVKIVIGVTVFIVLLILLAQLYFNHKKNNELKQAKATLSRIFEAMTAAREKGVGFFYLMAPSRNWRLIYFPNQNPITVGDSVATGAPALARTDRVPAYPSPVCGDEPCLCICLKEYGKYDCRRTYAICQKIYPRGSKISIPASVDFPSTAFDYRAFDSYRIVYFSEHSLYKVTSDLDSFDAREVLALGIGFQYSMSSKHKNSLLYLEPFKKIIEKANERDKLGTDSLLVLLEYGSELYSYTLTDPIDPFNLQIQNPFPKGIRDVDGNSVCESNFPQEVTQVCDSTDLGLTEQMHKQFCYKLLCMSHYLKETYDIAKTDDDRTRVFLEEVHTGVKNPSLVAGKDDQVNAETAALIKTFNMGLDIDELFKLYKSKLYVGAI